MVKRGFHENREDAFGAPVQEPKRRLMFNNGFMGKITLEELESVLGPLVQKVVQEEVGKVIHRVLHITARTLPNQVETSQNRGLQLHFLGQLPSSIFTGSAIQAEGGGPVKIVLVDAVTKTPIVSGPQSSVKIEILLLDGDFGFDDQDHWTEEELKAKIVRERDGKRKLLIGQLNVALQDGVGFIGDIIVTDNSSWIKCGRFRLGARCSETGIREGISKAFRVKDHRGESNKKHYPPSSNDEIWRLLKISKEGKYCQRLTSNGIHTVGDFLRFYMTNPTTLHKLLYGRENIWKVVVDHARTCITDDDDTFYSYHDGEERVLLLLDSVYRPVAATFDGQIYQLLEQLSCYQKHLVEVVKKRAYKNVNKFLPVDACKIFGPSWPLTDIHLALCGESNSDLQRLDEFPATHQAPQIDYNQGSTSRFYNQEIEESHGIQFSVAQSSNAIPEFNPIFRNSLRRGEFFPSPCNGETILSPYCSQASILPSNHLTTEEIPQVSTPTTWPPVNNMYAQDNSTFFFPPGGSTFPSFVHISTSGKNRVAWCKVKAAIKWRLLAARISARHARCLNYCFH